jgi:hypothetical protein
MEVGAIKVSMHRNNLTLERIRRLKGVRNSKIYPFHLDATQSIYIWGKIECASPLLF